MQGNVSLAVPSRAFVFVDMYNIANSISPESNHIISALAARP